MNSIELCINRQEYVAGARVFGAVYVNVVEPTAATGILLSFLGQEHYSYHCVQSKDPDEHNRVLQDCTEYIPKSDILLYNSKQALSLGKYVIPFQVKIPDVCPPTFHLHSLSGPEWSATISYKMQALFVGEYQCRLSTYSQVKDSEVELFVESLTFAITPPPVSVVSKSKLKVTAFVDKPVYYTGETMKLSICFANEELANKVKLSHIDIALYRQLQIGVRNERVPDIDSHLLTNPKGDLVYICPETELEPLWTGKLVETDVSKLIKGVQNMFIPLCPKRIRQSLPPSVNGKFIKSSYWVSIGIFLRTGSILLRSETVSLTLPLPIIKTRNESCFHLEPSWTGENNCRLLKAESGVAAILQDTRKEDMNNLPKTWEKMSAGYRKKSCE